MGRYIAKADVDSRWGEGNIIVWSNRDNDAATADTGAIDTAIAAAEEWVDARFRGGPYKVPLVGTEQAIPYLVQEWCATYAGIKLYRGRMRRDPGMLQNLSEVEQELRAEIGGMVSGTGGELALERARSSMPMGPEVVL